MAMNIPPYTIRHTWSLVDLAAYGDQIIEAPQTEWLLLRYLVVDHFQVHPLGAAEQAEGDVDPDRDGVQDQHVDERLAVVDTVGIVEKPRQQAEDKETSESHRGDRDEGKTQDAVAGYRGGVVDVRLEPWHQRRRDRRAEEGDRDDEHSVEHVGGEVLPEGVRVAHGDGRYEHQEQRRVGDAVVGRPGDPFGEHPVEGRGENDARGGEEDRSRPPEEPQRHHG